MEQRRAEQFRGVLATMKLSRFVIGLPAIAMLLLHPQVAIGHAPYQPTVIFWHFGFPDRPIAEFAKGRLGIIEPSWSRGYRVVAYRYLTGRPLSPTEQRSFLAFKELHPHRALRPRRPDDWRNSGQENRAPQQWVEARAKFRKDKPPSPGAEDWWSYTSGEGCLEDSFRTAIRTLHDRAKRYGPKELQGWITAQDQVFQNCAFDIRSKSHGDAVPAELPANAGSLARVDRAYQIAAAHFYAGNSNEAIRRFEAIGRDMNSPWRELGAYLAARMVLRKATANDSLSFDPKLLAEADARLKTASDQIRSHQLKTSITGLRQFIALRLNPGEQYRLVANRIATGGSGAAFGQDAMDLGFLIDRTIGSAPDFPGVNEWNKEYESKLDEWLNRRYVEVRDQRTSSDLTDWLMTFELNSPAAAAHALQLWKRTGSLPWLVAALSVAHGNDETSRLLIRAASQVEPSSPAYPTVSLYRARILREQGESAAARRLLDDVLQHASNLPISTVNELREERLLLADSAEAFVRFLPQQPIGFSNGSMTKGESEYCAADSPYRFSPSMGCDKGIFEEGTPSRLLPQLDDGAARMLNQSAPLSFLISVAHSDALPENIRRQLAPAVWARATLLGRRREAAEIVGVAAEMRPELKPYIAQYETATSDEERRFLVAFAIAHFPGLRPAVNGSTPRVTRFDNADDFRDNWWCTEGLPAEFHSWNEKEARPIAVPQIPFLSTEEHARAADEFQHIVALGPAGDWLSNILITWAKEHPQDPRSPEAMHFAWRAMRYRCDGKGNRSREVYVLLHKRYPASVWTKKTRVWW
jgi:tetratricopeptide (TPR) repeat protein